MIRLRLSKPGWPALLLMQGADWAGLMKLTTRDESTKGRRGAECILRFIRYLSSAKRSRIIV